MRLHAVAAENLQFMRDDSSHRERRLGLISEEQSDLNVPAAPAEREDRISTGNRAAEGVNGDVNPACRDIANGLRDVRDIVRINRARGPGLAGEGEFIIRNVDADDLRAERVRNHHRRKADPAASVHRYPLAGSQPRLFRDSAKRRHKAATERRGVDEFHLVGKAYEVGVGEGQGDIFGERAGPCESWLKLFFADLLVARETVNTGSATEYERGSHPVADPPSMRVGTDRGDHPGELMARNMR